MLKRFANVPRPLKLSVLPKRFVEKRLVVVALVVVELALVMLVLLRFVMVDEALITSPAT